MKPLILSTLAAIAAAAHAPNKCGIAVWGLKASLRSSHSSDCASYLHCKKTTRVSATTTTTTQTITRNPERTTVTTTRPDGITTTIVTTLPPVTTSTTSTLPDSTTLVEETPTLVVTTITVTPNPTTETTTVTPSPITTVTTTVPANGKRRKRGTTSSPQPYCGTRIPAYASKACGGSGAKYASACACFGLHAKTATTTVYGTTRTVTVTTTAGPTVTQTSVVTQPAPTVTVTETAPASTVTATVTASASTETVTATLPTPTTSTSTTLGVATTTATTTLPPTTATATVTASPPPLCGNAGLSWILFSDADDVSTDTAKAAWDPTVLRGAGAASQYEQQGTTNYLGYVGGGNLYNGATRADPEHFALEHRGYLFVAEAGTYQFTARGIDDLTLVWLGPTAYAGWTRDNRDQYVASTDPGGTGNGTPGDGTLSVAFPASQIGTYVPFRLVFKQGQFDGNLLYSVTSPGGTTLIGSDPSTATNSPYVVLFSCDGTTAPPFRSYVDED